MEKNIKNYLHLYLECECLLENGKKIILDTSALNSIYGYAQLKAKPILRPLSDMTGKELNQVENLLPTDESIDDEDAIEMLKSSAGATLFLLNKHFDLFGLIDAGLAIDKTTLK